MKKLLLLFLLLLALPLFAKDPMGRGKSAFQPGRSYPQVDISGYEELEYNSLDQSGDPQKYQNSVEYLNLPASVRVYDGLRHRRLIDLEGQISEKLYVRYKISQDPDLPQETDIYVEYDRFSVYFGKYDAVMTNGELFSMNKNIDGLYMDYLADNFEIEGIYGEERSHERTFSFNGSGKREYNLGQTNISEGSLKVFLNGEALSEDEYRVDYFDGTIIFNKILSVLDSVQGTYEYLDPIEDFLPIASKVRLSGLQHRYMSYRGAEPVMLTASAVQKYEPPDYTAPSSALETLRQAPQFQYQERNIRVTVAAPQAQAVYLHLDAVNSADKLPLRQEDGLWTVSLPSGPQERRVALEYALPDYSLVYVCTVSFVERTVTAAAVISAEDTALEEQPVSGAPEIMGPAAPPAAQEVLVKKYFAEVTPEPEYLVLLPEGEVRFAQADFRQNSILRFTFRPQDRALEKAGVSFKKEYQDLRRLESGDYILEKPLTVEEQPGENNCFLVLNYDGTEVVRKIPFIVTYDETQQSDLKRLQLLEYPLLSFSEKIYYGNQLLAPNQDYKINYATGMVTFLRPIPTDTWELRVEYGYNQTKAVQEIIKGAESQGPYKLANRLIVPESVSVMVNNLNMLEGADYKLDAANGALSFARRISSVDTIQVSYKFYVSLTPEASQRREQFSISSYFVQEQAKSAEAESDTSHTLSGGDFTLTTNGQVTTINIPAKYLPLKNPQVYDNGIPVSRDNYLVSESISEYSGLIVLSGNYTANTLTITFDQYNTVIAPKVYFSGDKYDQTRVILDDIVANLPKPIVYESMILELKSRNSLYYVPLVYKRDYIVGYREDLSPGAKDANGDAVVRDNQEAWQRGVITFITGNINSGYNVYSGFSQDDQFRLTYKISDAGSTDPGDIMHQTYGTKFTYSPTDWLRADVEYNESRKQYQRSVASGMVTANGDGSAQQSITIMDQNQKVLELVENSEKVYINDRLQIQNEHYSVSYKSGLLRFRAGMILSPSDNIRIEFQYYSNVGEEESIDETAKAAKVGVTMRLGNTDITAGYVTVDSRYDPVGNAPALYVPGTEGKNIIINSRPTERLQLYSRTEQLDTRLGPYADEETLDRYQSTVLQNYKAVYGFNANDSIALAYNRTDVEQPGSTREQAGANNRQQDYQMDLNFGPEAIRTGVFLKNAESFADNYDTLESSRIYNRNVKLTNYFRPFKNLNFTSSYARNIDDQFTASRALNESHAYTELVRYNPWTIDASLEYSGADYVKGMAENHEDFARTLGQDRRQVFNFTFRRPPELSSALWEELYAHYDNTYSSIATDLHQQAPDISRLNNLNAGLRPYDLVTLGYEDRYSFRILENYNREDFYQENVYKLSRFYPTKYLKFLPDDFLIVNKLELAKKVNENGRNAQSGETLRTYSIDNYYTVVQSYSLNPLAELSLDLQFDSKNVERYSEVLYKTGISTTETLEPENIQSMDLRYSLPGFLILDNLEYTWKAALSQKSINKTIVNLLDAPTRNKDALDSNTHRMGLVYNYLGFFTNTHALQTLEEYKRKTQEGSRYSYGQTDTLAMRYDIPFTGLGLTYGLTRVYNNQFRHTDETLSRARLLKDTYNEKLLRYDDTQQYKVDYTFLPQLLADASLYFRSVEQTMVSGNMTGQAQKIRGTINTRSYELGITYKLLADLSLRYGWRQNIFDLGYGEESRFTAKYTPLKFDFGELSYDYENVFTYGKGTNDPEQNDSMNNQNGFVQTAVVDRDDIKVTNTLVFKVNQDISNVIIDNLVIDINLTRLHFWDKINDSYSYSLNAFYAKGTINF
ncbi:MAG: hypothetical protein LBQ83_07015 [Candidatus Margulisbacteria bacterium]|nr:hypothetical protein [Candidatus Margulisiibacteriota bacterium]